MVYHLQKNVVNAKMECILFAKSYKPEMVYVKTVQTVKEIELIESGKFPISIDEKNIIISTNRRKEKDKLSLNLGPSLLLNT